jgi:histidyl-tRNA synthetase
MELELAKGVKDIPPKEKTLMNDIINCMSKIFELYGYLPLETSIIERYDTLAAKFAAGEASDALREVFKFKDQGNRDLGLRFDLTVPLCRYIAMNPTIKLPFKRYEVGPVFRDGPIRLGRTRQFWQMDIDTVGCSSMLADAEIIAMVDNVFKELGLEVVLKINNRKLLNGILEQVGIKEKGKAIISIDKLTKIKKVGVSKELLETGYSQEQIDAIFKFIKPSIPLSDLKKLVINEEGLEGIKELENIFSYLDIMNITFASFDISLARGLTYYTSTVFEVYTKEGNIKSSLAGGGRYDKMIGNYLGNNNIIPATGISFGLVPIIEAIKEKKTIEKKSVSKVYVIPLGKIKESLILTQELRKNKIPTSIDLMNRGVSKNLEYANTLEIQYVIFVGEKEIEMKKYKLRDMSSGKEVLLTLKELIEELK